MTYNIRTASQWALRDGGDYRFRRTWPERKLRVAKSIEIGKASIVGTQEGLGWQLDELVTVLGPSWKRVGNGRLGDASENDEYAAILYDSNLVEVIDSTDFWLSPTPNTKGSLGWGASLPRIATAARFRFFEEKEMVIINTHLDHSSDRARTEAAKLLRQAASILQASIVMGDFNACKDEQWFFELTKSSLLVDAWPLATIRKTGSAGQSTFHDWYGGKHVTAQWLRPHHSQEHILSGQRHIDAIFIASKLVPNLVTIARAGLVTDDKRRLAYGGPFASDHYPVVIDLLFSSLVPDVRDESSSRRKRKAEDETKHDSKNDAHPPQASSLTSATTMVALLAAAFSSIDSEL